MIKVLHYIPGFLYGGIESMFLSWYRNINKDEVTFELLLRTQDDGAQALKEYRDMGGRYYRLSKLSPKNILSFRKGVKEFFKKHHDYDILHVHGNSIFVMYYAKKYGIKKIVVHSHSTDSDKGVKSTIRRIYGKYAMRRYADYAFACSKLAAQYKYGGLYFKNKPVSIIHNAIETKKYEYNIYTRERIRKEYKWDNKFIIGHVGRLTYQKNQFFIIDIFNEFQKKDSNSLLVIVGDGPDEEGLKEYILSLGIESKVVFMGTKNNINELLQGFDVFFLPSRYEGLPVTLIEAQASGLPCIVSNVISEEADITNNVIRLSLTDSTEKWKRAISKTKQHIRIGTTKQIVGAGYDISSEVDRLIEQYRIIKEGY